MVSAAPAGSVGRGRAPRSFSATNDMCEPTPCLTELPSETLQAPMVRLTLQASPSSLRVMQMERPRCINHAGRSSIPRNGPEQIRRPNCSRSAASH